MIIETKSLLDEIRAIHEKKESGILTLKVDSHRVAVFYREGMIQAVSANAELLRLGDYMIEGGYLTERDVPVLLKTARRNRLLFGEAAVRAGHLDVQELGEVVRWQAVELLQRFLTTDCVSDFAEGVRSFYIPANIGFGYLSLQICRAGSEPLNIDATWTIRLRDGIDLPEMPWNPEELNILGELTHPTTLETLLVSSGISGADLRRILGVFDRLGIIEFDPDGGSVPQQQAIVKRTSFPFDGVIPMVTDALISERLEVLKNPSSFISEQFRNLKVRISRSDEAPPKVITLTSPEHADGKSLIAVNLAASFSMEAGRRVIILDCDLRLPKLHNYLGVSEGPGLFQYLSNNHLAPHCYVRRLDNMFFMTAGGFADNPIELLSLRRMKDLIEYFKRDFDTIILDAPPVFPIADTRVISPLSDGLIMVIRRGKTSYRNIEGALKVIDQSKFLGVVFNDVKPMLFHTHYDSGHYGQYGYGYYAAGRNARNLNAPRGRRVRPTNYLPR